MLSADAYDLLQGLIDKLRHDVDRLRWMWLTFEKPYSKEASQAPPSSRLGVLAFLWRFFGWQRLDDAGVRCGGPLVLALDAEEQCAYDAIRGDLAKSNGPMAARGALLTDRHVSLSPMPQDMAIHAHLRRSDERSRRIAYDVSAFAAWTHSSAAFNARSSRTVPNIPLTLK
jgi:hypothetical protein